VRTKPRTGIDTFDPRYVWHNGRRFKRVGGGSPAVAAPPAHQEQAQPAAQPLIPFVSAAHEHTEPAFTLTSALTGASQQLNVPDVPAYGYLRHILLEVTCSGGVLGPGVLHEDAPWNLFQSISLVDTNGAPIFGPLDGYSTLWSNIVGGYAYSQDPRKSPWFATGVNFKFFLRIPIEIAHYNALGCLTNQNAAGAYKVQLSLNPSTTIFSTAPTTLPTVQIKAHLEAWSQPNDVDVAGRPQAQYPPAHGTAQFWSRRSGIPVVAGNNTIPLTRVGSLIRNIVFIARTAAGARSDTVFPDPVSIQWDARVQWQESQNYRIQKMFEAIENLQSRDTGVFWLNFNTALQGRAGDGPPTLWLPTVQATRLEVDGVAAAAGSLDILTNDISLAEVVAAERYVETSQTGFHPEVGVANPAAQ
jgi:hypothetical protein